MLYECIILLMDDHNTTTGKGLDDNTIICIGYLCYKVRTNWPLKILYILRYPLSQPLLNNLKSKDIFITFI